ncbi:MAG: hypothetical protein HY815_01070 [Candidatus Riflebacteria bacterium]|nr:hypothetical protein [Candidatus Riflebacteria bacterium]
MFRCEVCGRTWDEGAARQCKMVCSPGCGGTLVIVETELGGQLPGQPSSELPQRTAGLPTPIDLPFRRYQQEPQPFLRLHRLCEAVDALTRFTATILLSDVVRLSRALPQRIKSTVLRQLERPWPGAWSEITREACGALAGQLNLKFHRGGAFIPELVKMATSSLLPLAGSVDGDPNRELLALGSLLNESERLPDQHCQELLVKHRYQARCMELFGQLEFLSGFALFGVGGDGLGVLLDGPPPPTGHVRYDLRPHLDPKSTLTPLPGAKLQSPDDAPRMRTVLVKLSQPRALWLEVTPARIFEQIRPAGHEVLDLGRPTLAQSPSGRSEWLDFSVLTPAMANGQPPEEAFHELGLMYHLERWYLAATAAGESRAFSFADRLVELSDPFVGRNEQLRRVGEWFKENREGVVWITGPVGVGKSALMANIAKKFFTEPQMAVKVVHFFREGDPRSGRAELLRSAIRTLASASGKRSVRVEEDQARREVQLKDMLRQFVQDEATRPEAARRRVIFVLDGLNEPGAGPVVADWALGCKLPGVSWILAGRPDPELLRVLRSDLCTWLFAGEPGGMLHLLDDAAVATQLSNECRRPASPFLQKTPQEADALISALVKAVCGHPVFMRLVTSDIREGRFPFDSATQDYVPAGLDDYWRDVLDRLHVSDVGTIMTPVFCALAMAREPLSRPVLLRLLSDHGEFSDASGPQTLDRVLEAGRSLLKASPTSRGIEGVTLLHPSLKNHILSQANVPFTISRTRARFLRVVKSWATLESDPDTHDYTLRHATSHLLESRAAIDLMTLLTDPRFLRRKVNLVGVPALLLDFTNLPPDKGFPPPDDRKKLGALGKALEKLAPKLREDPEQLESALLNELLTSEGDQAWITQLVDAFVKRGVGAGDRPILLRRKRPETLLAADQLNALMGPANRVTALAYSPDARCLALALEANHVVKVWDLQARKEVATLKGHQDHVGAVAFSPDGRKIVTGSADHTVKSWDATTGKNLATLTGHTEQVTAVAFTPNNRILTGSWDETMRFWDASSGQPLTVLSGGPRVAHCLTFSPDGTRFISGSWEKVLRIWDAATAQLLATLSGHADRVTAVAFSPGGEWIASGSNDGTIKIWSALALSLVASMDVGAPVMSCRFLAGSSSFQVVEEGGAARQPRLHQFELIGPAAGPRATPPRR